MDWPDAATELLMRSSQEALVLLDNAGKTRSINHALEHILGYRREEIEGKTWMSLVTPLGKVPGGSQWLKQILAGAFGQHRARARTKDGRDIFLRVEVCRLKQHMQHWLLLAVQVAEQGPSFEGVVAGSDFDYCIKVSTIEFGILQSITTLGRPVRLMAGEGRKCFQFFGRGRTPCPDCPALRPMPEPWPRIHARKLNGSTEVITGYPVDAVTIQLSVRTIDDHMLAAIHETRIGALADKARLSGRERDVFKYLLMGRTQQDIADVLELSRRTVKFHAKNVLEKVGADSRVDLFRLLSF